jgi:MFS family permease
MGCSLTLIGAIVGLIVGPIIGMIIGEVLSGETAPTARAESGFPGFVYGVFCGPFIGMIALPALPSLLSCFRRRKRRSGM